MTDEELRELLASHSETIRRDFDAAVVRFESQSEETRSHFDVTAERFDTRFDLLAEAVIQLDQKLDRTAERLDEKIDRTAAETQAMIRFLAHRVTALEEGHRSPE